MQSDWSKYELSEADMLFYNNIFRIYDCFMNLYKMVILI
jgi:hypothetical protein